MHVRQERQENRLFFLQSCGASLLLPRALLSVKICLEAPFFSSFFFFVVFSQVIPARYEGTKGRQAGRPGIMPAHRWKCPSHEPCLEAPFTYTIFFFWTRSLVGYTLVLFIFQQAVHGIIVFFHLVAKFNPATVNQCIAADKH